MKLLAVIYVFILNVTKKMLQQTNQFCIEYSKESFSFSSKVVSSPQLKETNQNFSQKNKKRLHNEEKLINQINDATKSSELPNLTTYYSIDKSTENSKFNSFNGTKLLYLNMSSLPYNYE